jgi:protein TonB
VKNRRTFRLLYEVRHRVLVLLGAVGLTLVFFIVLPLMQTISRPPRDDLVLQTVDLANVPPPPAAPPEEEPEQKPEPEQSPPELTEKAPPLDLAQLELALNPGLGDGWAAGADFAVKLNTFAASASDNDLNSIFSMADLDQKPRPIYQPSPILTRQLREKTPATVYILFVVDERGSVAESMVQQSSDPLFEKPAMSAVKQWKFEPGKRAGKAVRFRMRVPITFPKG